METVMVMRVQFWRHDESPDGRRVAVVKTYFFFAPDQLAKERALEMAKCELCAWAGVKQWKEAATGYDLHYSVEEASV